MQQNIIMISNPLLCLQRTCDKHHQLGTNLSPMYIHVYDPARQPQVDTPCQNNNGGCSHLCLAAPAPKKFSCACPTGVKLIDNYTCANGIVFALIIDSADTVS